MSFATYTASASSVDTAVPSTVTPLSERAITVAPSGASAPA